MSVSADQVRSLALALPETSEGDDHGAPAFLVAGKIFCTLGAERFTIKLTVEDQENLAGGHPGVITPVDGYWGRKGWTHARFAESDTGTVQMLLALAWATVAPKRLLKSPKGC
jgi:hypothetical protein